MPSISAGIYIVPCKAAQSTTRLFLHEDFVSVCAFIAATTTSAGVDCTGLCNLDPVVGVVCEAPQRRTRMLLHAAARRPQCHRMMLAIREHPLSYGGRIVLSALATQAPAALSVSVLAGCVGSDANARFSHVFF